MMVFASNDPANFEPFISGDKTLAELSASGVDCSVVSEILVTVKPGPHGDQVTRKLRFSDSQLATTTLSRMSGLLDERRRVELSGMVGVAALDLRDKSDEELEAIRHALLAGQPPPKLLPPDSPDVPDLKKQVADVLVDEVIG